jgi:hypothetical protein
MIDKVPAEAGIHEATLYKKKYVWQENSLDVGGENIFWESSESRSKYQGKITVM